MPRVDQDGPWEQCCAGCADLYPGVGLLGGEARSWGFYGLKSGRQAQRPGGAEPGHLKFHPDPPDGLIFPQCLRWPSPTPTEEPPQGARGAGGRGEARADSGSEWQARSRGGRCGAVCWVPLPRVHSVPQAVPPALPAPTWALLSGSLEDSGSHHPVRWAGATARTRALGHGQLCGGDGVAFPRGQVTDTHLAKTE